MENKSYLRLQRDHRTEDPTVTRFLRIALLCVVIGTQNTRADPLHVTLGLIEKELLAQNGRPTGVISAGNKTIYRWPTMVVSLQDGKVVSIQTIDAAKEKQDEAQRAVAAADENAKLAKGEAAQEKQQEAIAAGQQKQAAYKAKYDIALADYKAKLETYKREEAALDAHRASLDSEIRSLNAQLATARAQGNDNQIFTLRDLLWAKTNELKAVSQQTISCPSMEYP